MRLPSEKYGEIVAAAVVLSQQQQDTAAAAADIKKFAGTKLAKFKASTPFPPCRNWQQKPSVLFSSWCSSPPVTHQLPSAPALSEHKKTNGKGAACFRAIPSTAVAGHTGFRAPATRVRKRL